MSHTVKVMLGNQEVNALEVDFEIHKEDWNKYQLVDGTIVRVKTTVSRIYQVVDDKGNIQYHPDGSPWVVVHHKSDIITSL